MTPDQQSQTFTTLDESAGPVYPHPDSRQAASLPDRLRRMRLTWRRLLVYAASLAVLFFAAPMPATFAIGASLVMLGVAIRIWTFGHLRKNLNLTTTGPYAYTRNPAYLGSALIMTGLFFAAGNDHTVAGLGLWCAGGLAIVIFFSMYLPRKYSREYGQLTRLFPVEIERHAAHVPNFVPRLTPWRSGDERRFSWQCVKANHELVWPLICCAALAIIWV